MDRGKLPLDNSRAESPAAARAVALPWRVAVIGAAIAFSSGAGLVAYFVSGLSLPLGIGLAFAVTATVGVIVWRRLDPARRRVVRRRVRAGLVAGLAATAAYDVTRFAVVNLFHLNVRPYAALPVFGQLLVNVPADTGIAWLAGIGYHVVNGVSFSVAYTMLAGSRGVVAGIAFALVLEAFMLTFYPGWLHIEAIAEFFSMTILGHVAYGATLGWLSRRLLRTAATSVVVT